MICVDTRAGSKNLAPLFPSELVLEFELPAGDLLFTGPDDEFLTCIEHKRVMDVLTCIVTGRFAGTQLPAMLEVCDDNWLLIEGPFSLGARGELMVKSGSGNWYQAHLGSRYFKWSDFETWQITMQTRTPIKIKTTQSRTETQKWLMTLYSWWEKKDKHRSHLVTDKSRREADLNGASLVRRVAEQLPGIGHDKAFRVEAAFPDVFEMVVADQKEWERIEGVGPTMAKRITEAIRNGRT